MLLTSLKMESLWQLDLAADPSNTRINFQFSKRSVHTENEVWETKIENCSSWNWEEENTLLKPLHCSHFIWRHVSFSNFVHSRDVFSVCTARKPRIVSIHWRDERRHWSSTLTLIDLWLVNVIQYIYTQIEMDIVRQILPQPTQFIRKIV